MSFVSFQLGKTFSGGVVSATIEQLRRKANMVAQADGKVGPPEAHTDPRIPPNQKQLIEELKTYLDRHVVELLKILILNKFLSAPLGSRRGRLSVDPALFSLPPTLDRLPLTPLGTLPFLLQLLIVLKGLLVLDKIVVWIPIVDEVFNVVVFVFFFRVVLVEILGVVIGGLGFGRVEARGQEVCRHRREDVLGILAFDRL